MGPQGAHHPLAWSQLRAGALDYFADDLVYGSRAVLSVVTRPPGPVEPRHITAAQAGGAASVGGPGRQRAAKSHWVPPYARQSRAATRGTPTSASPLTSTNSGYPVSGATADETPYGTRAAQYAVTWTGTPSPWLRDLAPEAPSPRELVCRRAGRGACSSPGRGGRRSPFLTPPSCWSVWPPVSPAYCCRPRCATTAWTGPRSGSRSSPSPADGCWRAWARAS